MDIGHAIPLPPSSTLDCIRYKLYYNIPFSYGHNSTTCMHRAP